MDWVYDIVLRINQSAMAATDFEDYVRLMNASALVAEARRCGVGKFALSAGGPPVAFDCPLVTDAPGYFIDGLKNLMPLFEASRDVFCSLAASGGSAEIVVMVHFGVMSGFDLDLDLVCRLLQMKIEMRVDYLSWLETVDA